VWIEVKMVREVNPEEIDAILHTVEEMVGVDEANALRAYLDSLRGKIRILQLGENCDDWQVL
jgi:hypothetical protein